MPIFNKGVKAEIFVYPGHDRNDSMRLNINIKNTDGVKFPIAIYKIINIEDKIINNLNVGMNNKYDSCDLVPNNKSDKNYKIYDESGIIRVGKDDSQQTDDKHLYITARMEIKKNITYVFNTSMNAIFARQYINIQNESYKCSLNSRNDNKYLVCLVITALENHIIENGVQLMYNIN